ncbi:bacillithiol system redox-active protein YtxJ [Sediminibacterium soli]|uniref:bacillithiol system redox-active protein YtxJ n=1 Tax=Sediminibacterium soli TaxID=2698829 RepID=UPI001379E1F9|nr:bacillithiol system redox-active protein YtxJ [Sediminibacterium soli]NCI46476.1 bacillithiol system redox-active protein YtxJ [Sediminibacterium soli]
MNWTELKTDDQLVQLVKDSTTRPQVIFKHSTRCSISSTVLSRLERSAAPSGMDFYFLDLIRYRTLSNRIAERFSVHHESPQVLLIKNGECMYDESHMAISMDELEQEFS